MNFIRKIPALVTLPSFSTCVGILFIVVFLILVAALTKTSPKSWNDRSHIAAIESFVERGTWSINDSPWEERTQDKAWHHGRFYSDKMPLLALIGSGVYAILHYGFNESLVPNCAQAGQFCAYRDLTFVLVGIPAALMLWLFFDFARRCRVPLWAALIGTIALGFGTMVFPYALVFNHHVPAAASLFAGFYILTTNAAMTRWRTMTVGFLLALGLSIDILSGAMAAGLFVIALLRNRSQMGYIVLGAIIPIAMTVLLNYEITQTFLPPYLVPEVFAFHGSAFPATIGGNSPPDDYVANAFIMFVGRKGLFSFNPILLFALAGVGKIVRNSKHPLWMEAIGVLVGFLMVAFYLVTNTTDFSGSSYGERWFISSLPTLLAFIFFTSPLNLLTWKNPAWILFISALGLSVFSSFEGAQAPWQDWLPPLQMMRTADWKMLGFKWNMK